MKLTNSCKKMKLPNGKVVDILSSVFEEISNWIQNSEEKKEAGGYIVGYQHSKTGNITLENISIPYKFDKRTRFYFGMRDPRHQLFLLNQSREKSFYMGVWHTHPEINPEPSTIDWNDWDETLDVDRTGCNYIFFVIAGIHELRFWVGDFESKEIVEIFECKKVGDLYES